MAIFVFLSTLSIDQICLIFNRIAKEKGYPGAGYNIKNRKLIEWLDITEDEQRHLKTILGTQEKYRRNNLRRTPRNEAGLTPREQQKKDNIKAVKELAEQGFKQVEIAKRLNITDRHVRRILTGK